MEELLAQTGYSIPTIRRGQEVSGKVVSVSHSEILIEIGAKSEGIVAGRELASVADLVSKLSVGDKVDATVLFVENDAGQVVLSLRKLSGEKRWQELEEKLANKEGIEVKVLEANRGGIICDWLGLRGFLPASQLLQTPSKLDDLIGKTLTVQVLEVDRSTNRLIFSQKHRDSRDLSELLELFLRIKLGQQFSGVVTAVLPFGMFVEIDVGSSGSQVVRSSGKKKPDSLATRQPDNPGKLEGLVHISEISWEKVDDPAKLFKVGDTVDVMVIAKDEETGRLNLSIKQLVPDPFIAASSKYSKDQSVSGTVSRVTGYGVFVTLSDGVEGLVHISKIAPNISYRQGDPVECLVEAVDARSRRISLVPVAREKPVLYR